MKLFRSAFFWLMVLAPTVAAQADTVNIFLQILNVIIGFLIAPYINLVAPEICSNGVEALDLDAVLNCQCTGEYQNFGIVGSVDCGLQQGVKPCLLPPSTFCGAPSLVATFSANGAGLSGSLGACFEFETGLPPVLAGIFSVPELCVEAVAPSGLAFSQCRVKLGSTNCASCTICDPTTEGGYFKFDCSNVDLIPGLGTAFPGPKLDTCLGFGFNPAA